jgi:hypothetical protein
MYLKTSPLLDGIDWSLGWLIALPSMALSGEVWGWAQPGCLNAKAGPSGRSLPAGAGRVLASRMLLKLAPPPCSSCRLRRMPAGGEPGWAQPGCYQ